MSRMRPRNRSLVFETHVPACDGRADLDGGARERRRFVARSVATSAALVCAALAGCSSDTPIVRDVPLVRDVLPSPPFPQGWQVADLTMPLDASSPRLAHARQFPFERMEMPPAEKGAPRTGAFTAMEHMGTHLAAPRTREEAGATIDQFGAANLLLPVAVIDVPPGAASEAALSAETLKDDERAHGEIPTGAAVLLRTRAGPSVAAHAGLAGPAVRWLVKERDARVIGTDAPACDTSAAPRGPAQSVAASVGAWTLVNLRGLDALPARGAWIVIGALPIAGAAGAPARVVAFIPPEAVVTRPSADRR